MNFSLHTQKAEKGTTLRLVGRLTLGEAVETLHAAVRKLIAAGERNLVLDLGSVTYVDSAGLGAMVRTLTTTRREGGDLHLINITPRIYDLLEVGNLFRAFQLVESASARPPV